MPDERSHGQLQPARPQNARQTRMFGQLSTAGETDFSSHPYSVWLPTMSFDTMPKLKGCHRGEEE